ncbi:uncharacterized protein ARMOST_04362 [Armillaria ostoyae]|uniref:Uncharacterized protein n=1 Tax=Armillaria ostoyae TaxID=47428 RepID=A0A284QX48_ARMOS|nr:uncharacterized protein ARMOST_04362 [Armillaria ostoyae]
MGHTEESTKFDPLHRRRPRSCLSDRDENVEYVKAGKALMDMSARRDENAPKGLTSEGKVQLLAEPELVEMDNERKALANQIASLLKQLTCPDITIETRAEIEEQLILLKSDKKKIITKHEGEIVY